MKKLLFAGALTVLTILPGLKAQEAEAPNPDALEAKENQTEKKGFDPLAAGKDATAVPGKETEKNSPFAKRQKTINGIMEKLKKATKNADKRKYKEQLTREQRAYQSEVNQELKKLDDQITPLKERLRYTQGEKKQQLQKELADLEQKRQTLDQNANLEKWCAKPETIMKGSPDPGPGKKAAKNKKSKKSKKGKKSKGK